MHFNIFFVLIYNEFKQIKILILNMSFSLHIINNPKVIKPTFPNFKYSNLLHFKTDITEINNLQLT